MTEVPFKSEMHQGGRKRVNWVIEFSSKSEMGERGWKAVDWLIEFIIKPEVPKGMEETVLAC